MSLVLEAKPERAADAGTPVLPPRLGEDGGPPQGPQGILGDPNRFGLLAFRGD